MTCLERAFDAFENSLLGGNAKATGEVAPRSKILTTLKPRRRLVCARDEMFLLIPHWTRQFLPQKD
jgi:hypothetical protein